MLKRRLVSIGTLALVTIVMLCLAPLLILISLLWSLLPGWRTTIHALGFAYGYLFYEVVGVCRLTWAWLRYRNEPSYLERNQDIQYWWTSGLLNLGARLYGLSFEIFGSEAIDGPSAIMIPRHTSIGDTVLPMHFFAAARGEGMRYILKNELAVLPCLDIAGHRLPNYFIDRSGQDTPAELEAVRHLTREAGPEESVLIYPEGTRATPAKREQLRARRPHLAPQLQRWPDLLPPRLGGVQAMLEVNPGKDVVFLAHTGFEGSASLNDLMSGAWQGQAVRLHFWRVPFAEIPADTEAFLFEQWDQMQERVAALAQTG